MSTPVKQYKIISLRAQANGFKQRDVITAGTFNSYSEACAKADAMNASSERIYTTYSAMEIFK